jgi:hypothetical protein
MTGLRRCSVEEALDALKERQRMIQMAKSGDLENYTADESLDDFEVTKIESSMFTKANLTAALQVVG